MPQNPEESCALAQSEQQAAQPAFRIGGVYRKQGGDVVRLMNECTGDHLEKWQDEFPGMTFALMRSVNGCWSAGYVALQNGRYVCAMETPDHRDNLLPGELVKINGEWMPASQSIAFPSGAIVKTQGDKITGRVEPPAETKRAPLPYFTERTPFDPHRGAFSDWSYTFCTEGQDAGPLHPLQKENDGAVLCGSAHLLAD